MSRVTRSIVEPSDGFGSDGIAPTVRARTEISGVNNNPGEESDHRSPQGAAEDGDGAEGNIQTPLCYCGQHSIKLISRSSLNPNRPFFKCHKFKDDPTQCKFFQWEDETPVNTVRSPSRPPPATKPRYDRPTISFDPPNSFRQRNNNATTTNYGYEPHRQQEGAPTSQYGSGRTGACLRCGEEGHWAAECPAAGKKSTYTMNNNNGGGYNNSAGNRSTTTNMNGGNTGGRECFHCGEPGHWVRDCPLKHGDYNNNNSNGNNGGGGSGGFNSSQYRRNSGGNGYNGGGGGGCYKCGGQDHWVRDCPMNNNSGGYNNSNSNGGNRYAGSKRAYYENFL